MGGMGSGRTDGRATIEGCDSLSIDVARLLRGVRCPANSHVMGRARMNWSYSGEPWATVGIEFTINAGGFGWMRLQYDVEHYSRATGPQDQRIDLTGLPRPFGGFMWLAWCPLGGGLARKLYLPNGATRFASRSAYRLRYVVQSHTPMDRAHRRLGKLYRRLSGDYGGMHSAWPSKPKWMRWRTYQRLTEQIEAGNDALDAAFAPNMLRLIGRYGP